VRYLKADPAVHTGAILNDIDDLARQAHRNQLDYEAGVKAESKSVAELLDKYSALAKRRIKDYCDALERWRTLMERMHGRRVVIGKIANRHKRKMLVMLQARAKGDYPVVREVFRAAAAYLANKHGVEHRLPSLGAKE
jgi:hypothetical protein